MLTVQQARSESSGPQGRGRTELAELRRRLAEPSQLSDTHRQRLLDLSQRLASVRALGGEYRRVGLSRQAQAGIHGTHIAG